MDIREVNNFGCIEEEVNHWWIRTRFNYINEVRWTPNMEKIFLLSNQLRILI